MRGGREREEGDDLLPTGKVHISEITTTKFRSCSRHGKSFSVFKSHFLSQTFTPFAVAKRKGPATREVSGMHPREPQLSCRAAIVLQWSSKEKTVRGGWGKTGGRGRPGDEQSPMQVHPRATEGQASRPQLQQREETKRKGGRGKGKEKGKFLAFQGQGFPLRKPSAALGPGQGWGAEIFTFLLAG